MRADPAQRARERERKEREGKEREEVVEVKNKTVVGRKKIPREKKKYGRRDAERRVKKKREVRRTRGAREPRERGLNPYILGGKTRLFQRGRLRRKVRNTHSDSFLSVKPVF